MAKYARGLRSLRLHELLLGVGLLFSISAIAVLWWDGARQPFVENNFSYAADITEADNVYDPQNDRYTGTRYSTASLQMILGGSAENPTIVSKLTEKAADDSTQIQTRERPIDIRTGRYKDNGESGRESGYLFAPEGLVKGQSFYYQHISYEAPALMKFVEEDTVNGLSVFKYKADYSYLGRLEEKNIAGQAAGGQGLEYTPDLQVWIEPVSGWMVKYQEDTTLNVYDVASGKVIRPVRHFSNRMSDASIDQHVAYARTLNLKETFVREIAPSVILLILLVMIFSVALIHVKSAKSIPINIVLVVVTIIPAVALFGWLIPAMPLVTLFVDSVGMNPISALCFIFVGLAILARVREKQLLMTFFGGVICIIAGLQLLGSLEILPFQVDLLLFREVVLKLSETIPSRMSPYEAFTLFILGTVIIKAGLSTPRTVVHFARFVAGMVVMLGVFGALLQFLQLEKVFTLTFIQSLPIASSLLFVVCGFTLLNIFRRANDAPDDIKSTIRALLWPSLATVPIVIIGAFAQIQQHVVVQTLANKFKENITEVENALTNRVSIYSNTLVGARGLFASSQQVTGDEWRSYIETYNLPKQYPGITELGFAEILPGNATQIRPSSGSVVSIFPAKGGSWRAPITYLEPAASEANQQVGYDLLTDSVRSEAMEQARDTGMPRLSNKVTQPQSDGTTQIQTYLFVPVYKVGITPTTITERRAAIKGYVFGSIAMKRFIDNVVGARAIDIDFEVYDGLDTKSEALIYRRHPETVSSARLTEKSTIFIASQPWTVVYAAQPNFRLSVQEELSPVIMLVGGTIGYLGIISLIYLLVDYERRGRILGRLRKVRPGRK